MESMVMLLRWPIYNVERMVILWRWPIEWRENGHVTWASLMDGEWENGHIIEVATLMGVRMVMLQRWPV